MAPTLTTLQLEISCTIKDCHIAQLQNTIATMKFERLVDVMRVEQNVDSSVPFNVTTLSFTGS